MEIGPRSASSSKGWIVMGCTATSCKDESDSILASSPESPPFSTITELSLFWKTPVLKEHRYVRRPVFTGTLKGCLVVVLQCPGTSIERTPALHG